MTKEAVGWIDARALNNDELYISTIGGWSKKESRIFLKSIVPLAPITDYV